MLQEKRLLELKTSTIEENEHYIDSTDKIRWKIISKRARSPQTSSQNLILDQRVELETPLTPQWILYS